MSNEVYADGCVLANAPTPTTDELLCKDNHGNYFVRVEYTVHEGVELDPNDPQANRLEETGKLENAVRIVPVTKDQAAEWCVQKLIPDTIKGKCIMQRSAWSTGHKIGVALIIWATVTVLIHFKHWHEWIEWLAQL